MVLTWYRVRPLPWVALSAASLLVLSLTAFLGPGLGPVGASTGQFYATAACSLLIGVGGAFTLSSEVDPAQAVLQAAPKPFWRTPLLRVGLWLIVGTAALLALAWYAGRHCCLPASTIRAATLPDFLLACSLCFFVASFTGSYVGGAIGLSSLGAMTLLANLWVRFPLRPFDLPDAHTWRGSRWWITGVAGALLIGTFVRLRRSVLPARGQSDG